MRSWKNPGDLLLVNWHSVGYKVSPYDPIYFCPASGVTARACRISGLRESDCLVVGFAGLWKDWRDAIGTGLLLLAHGCVWLVSLAGELQVQLRRKMEAETRGQGHCPDDLLCFRLGTAVGWLDVVGRSARCGWRLKRDSLAQGCHRCWRPRCYSRYVLSGWYVVGHEPLQVKSAFSTHQSIKLSPSPLRTVRLGHIR